ncbi:LOW QUALITY PROTEIN: calpain-5-like [Lethenteron reissneri]|uniref:LOW QUALITY PROTEIN: calpain-5-like n=1 Tax=Lethenteron reissneri TaxID=7753 RepID=UPI002AB6CCAF|nr:LOW QUALITY PROTEIN: calpain-5-like [Lethenteron reissneri]
MPAARPYRDQSYSALRKGCLGRRELFTDPHFPHVNASLFYQKSPPGEIVWKRPGELCDDPRLFVDGISAHDLQQGSLGNCWFVAAASCLTLHQELWTKVIPDHKDQEWDPAHPEKYAGIFHFRFWRFGEWVDVVVDDSLPTHRGRLLFCHSNTSNEFWSALLEKAYAKLCGCYEALDGGNTSDALVDFTGGISESIDLAEEKFSEKDAERAALFSSMLKAYGRGGLLSCSIRALASTEMEARLDCGLVKGHAYSVTAVRRVRLGEGLVAFFRAERLNMIRMRNPWGEKEWNGAWSDGSEEWARVNKGEREKLGVTVSDDGEFWMTFDDWCKHFTDLVVCRIINTSYFSFHKTWEEVMLRGQWRHHDDPHTNRAGGCINDRTLFLQNPQFVFDVKKETDAILVSLQQRDRREHRKEGAGENLAMGLEIFRVEQNRKYRVHTIQEKMAESVYINSCSVLMRKELPQGRYVVVPTTFQPAEEGDFLLRVFTDVKSQCRELHKHAPKPGCCTFLVGYPVRVTSVHLLSAVGLPGAGSSWYAVVRAEGTKVRSRVYKNSSPEFDARAIFYRKKPNSPVTVEVWEKGVLSDSLLGRVAVPSEPTQQKELHVLRLERKGQELASMVNVWASTRDALDEL